LFVNLRFDDHFGSKINELRQMRNIFCLSPLFFLYSFSLNLLILSFPLSLSLLFIQLSIAALSFSFLHCKNISFLHYYLFAALFLRFVFLTYFRAVFRLAFVGLLVCLLFAVFFCL